MGFAPHERQPPLSREPYHSARPMNEVRMNMKTTFSTDPRVERSLRHSVRDGVAYSVMSGAGETYFAAYALFLGASAAQVSLLAAVPPLCGALMQLLAAWLEARLGQRRRLILTAALMHAFTWLPIIWLPYLFPAQAIPVTVSCIVLYYGWIGLGSPLWSGLMGELVPARKRGRFFGTRTQLMSIGSFCALVAGGVTLEFFEVRDNARLAFMLIFSAAAVARLYSVYQLAHMHEPAPPPARPIPPSRRRAHTPSRGFAHFSAFVAAMSFAVAVAGPFFTIYMLRDLQFSYLQFTVATAVSVMMQFLTLRSWGRLADMFGNRPILVLTGMVFPLLPTLWLLSSDFAWVLCVQALSGWAWGGFSLAASNYLHDIVPADRRASYWARHNVLNSVGACLGALLGGALSVKWPHSVEILGRTFQWTSGLWGLMLVSALLRGLVLLTFLGRIEEVRAVRAFSARLFVFQMIRSNRIAGFVLDRLGLGRRRRRLPRASARFKP